MNQLVTEAIILARTDYGEADRIITLLTPELGKIRLMAKGVRRVKSKLAGGIELFSVSIITYVKGKSDLGTLVSTRLVTHYGTIVTDLDRTMAGYDLIKQLHRVTEDEPEREYFTVLRSAFEALDDRTVSTEIIRFWFAAQLLHLSGHAPNLETDIDGRRLASDHTYAFSFDDMCFQIDDRGRFRPTHIKYLRLSFASHPAKVMAQVQGSSQLTSELAPLMYSMLQTYLRV